MKYIKKFEDNDNDNILYHKYDIVINEWYKTFEIFLILKDVYNLDEEFTCIYIGSICKINDINPYYNIRFSEFAVNIETKILNSDYIKINNKYKDLICDEIFVKNDKATKHYLSLIEILCGVNLKDLPELKNHYLKMSTSKFNL